MKSKLLKSISLSGVCLVLIAYGLSVQASWETWWEARVENRLASASQKLIINHQDKQRYYLVYVPESYNDNIPTPVVLNFHGGGGSPEGHQSTSRMNDKATSAGFIAVYPAGIRRDGEPFKLFNRFWNVGEGPNGPYYADSDPISRIDDIGFVDKLLDDLESKFNVDKDRIYATGLSNGGIFTHLIACRLTHRIAAIAPVAAPYWGYPDACAGATGSVSVILFHGTSDVCAPYDGGGSQCGSKAAIDRAFISAQETTDIWVKTNSCASTKKNTYQQGEVICETYDACANDSRVTLCTIEGGGHTWPGGRPYRLPGLNIGKTTFDIDANEAMWEFFEEHPKRKMEN
jgi:polyhydroxybutyrate depolymerase